MNKDRLYSNSAYRTKPAIRAQVTGRANGKYTCTTAYGRKIPGVRGGLASDYPLLTWVNLGICGGSYTILEIAGSGSEAVGG